MSSNVDVFCEDLRDPIYYSIVGSAAAMETCLSLRAA